MEQRPVDIDKIVQEFDGDACEFCERYKNKGLSRSSKLLLRFIQENEVRDRSVLDLGCGAGGLSLELLKEGASNAVGFDLSPKMIGAATELAQANGFQSRTKFQLGNAATSKLPGSDIVVLDKVLCCYPDMAPLLKNAIDASRGMIGFTVPRDDGVSKWCFRLGVRLVNFFQRRRGGLLFYLHPLDLVDKTLRDSGFNRRRKQGSMLWLVFLYSKIGN